jgi:hypothetical protein
MDRSSKAQVPLPMHQIVSPSALISQNLLPAVDQIININTKRSKQSRDITPQSKQSFVGKQKNYLAKLQADKPSVDYSNRGKQKSRQFKGYVSAGRSREQLHEETKQSNFSAALVHLLQSNQQNTFGVTFSGPQPLG